MHFMASLMRPDPHQFRPKTLCKSASYQQAMAEAKTQFESIPVVVLDCQFKPWEHRHTPGFFLEARFNDHATQKELGHPRVHEAPEWYVAKRSVIPKQDGWEAGKAEAVEYPTSRRRR